MLKAAADYTTDATFLKTLRDAAMKTSHYEYATELRWCADNIARITKELAEKPTGEALGLLNGLWARASRTLVNLPPEADPQAPLSGPTEPARLAA